MNKTTLRSQACEYSVPIWGYSLEKINKWGLDEGSMSLGVGLWVDLSQSQSVLSASHLWLKM